MSTTTFIYGKERRFSHVRLATLFTLDCAVDERCALVRARILAEQPVAEATRLVRVGESHREPAASRAGWHVRVAAFPELSGDVAPVVKEGLRSRRTHALADTGRAPRRRAMGGVAVRKTAEGAHGRDDVRGRRREQHEVDDGVVQSGRGRLDEERGLAAAAAKRALHEDGAWREQRGGRLDVGVRRDEPHDAGCRAGGRRGGRGGGDRRLGCWQPC
eukprot:2704488-Prymnesium_polylepis.1